MISALYEAYRKFEVFSYYAFSLVYLCRSLLEQQIDCLDNFAVSSRVTMSSEKVLGANLSV